MEVTQKRKEYCRRYILDSLPLLGLSHWKVAVHFAEIKDSYAKVEGPTYQNVCTITISPSFWKITRELRRQTITHELLHLVLAPYDEAVAAAVDDGAEKVLHTLTERVVDSLAWIVAPTLPVYKG